MLVVVVGILDTRMELSVSICASVEDDGPINRFLIHIGHRIAHRESKEILLLFASEEASNI